MESKGGDGMRLIDADAITYESIDSSDTGRHWQYHGTGIIAVRKKDIDEMPTIHPELHWIPVEQELPQIGEYVLCETTARYFGMYHVCKFVDKDKGVTEYG